MLNVRISAPESAAPGQLIEIKTLISHPMESGFRRDAVGKPIPRNILTEFVCFFDEREIFRADFFPAVAANPYLSFFTRVTASGTLTFQWTDQHGQVTREARRLTLVAGADGP